MIEKIRLDRVTAPERPIDQDLELVANDLVESGVLNGPDSVPFHEYRIKKTITPAALEAVAHIPFEVLLSEHDVGTTLLTGEKSAIWGENANHPNASANMRTKHEARYTLHNHPHTFIGNQSYGDMSVSRTSRSEVDFITGWDGITIHKLTSEDGLYTSDHQLSWKAQLAIKRGPDHELKYNLKHGYTSAFIPWTEKAKIQLICDYLNGTASWDTYKDRILADVV